MNIFFAVANLPVPGSRNFSNWVPVTGSDRQITGIPSRGQGGGGGGGGGWTRSIIAESAIFIAIDFEWDFFYLLSCCCFGCECSYSLPSCDWEDQVKCSQKSACTLVHLSNNYSVIQ